jgi:hypothetical protein
MQSDKKIQNLRIDLNHDTRQAVALAAAMPRIARGSDGFGAVMHGHWRV